MIFPASMLNAFLAVTILTKIVEAKKLTPVSSSPSDPSPEKVDSSLLVPFYIVLDPGVAQQAHFIPMNPYLEDLKETEGFEFEQNEVVGNSDPSTSVETQDSGQTSGSQVSKTNPSDSGEVYRHEITFMAHASLETPVLATHGSIPTPTSTSNESIELGTLSSTTISTVENSSAMGGSQICSVLCAMFVMFVTFLCVI